MELDSLVTEAMTSETSADDAQTVDTSVSIDDIMQDSASENDGETATEHGDSDHTEAQEAESEGETVKKPNHIKAALGNQYKKFKPSLDRMDEIDRVADGMTQEEILSLIRAEKARKMHEEDPDISPKAAEQILKARESVPREDPMVENIKNGLQSLMNAGWDSNQMQEFVADADVKAAINGGEDVQKVAFRWAFGKREAQNETPRKRGVPTTKSTAAGTSPYHNRIEDMSSSEFKEFQRRALDAMKAGKMVKM